MLSNDNRNRIFGASLVFAGIVGLIAPPIPAVRPCATELLSRAGIRVSYLAPAVAPFAPRATRVKVVKAHTVKIVLPTL